MKKTTNPSSSTSTAAIVGTLAVGVAVGWLLFPSNRALLARKWHKHTCKLGDTMKIGVYDLMEQTKKGLEQMSDRTNGYLQTEKALNAKILKLTLHIQEHYPEMSSFLEEMPVTIPKHNSPEVNLKNLTKYYDSLQAIMTNYSATHNKA